MVLTDFTARVNKIEVENDEELDGIMEESLEAQKEYFKPEHKDILKDAMDGLMYAQTVSYNVTPYMMNVVKDHPQTNIHSMLAGLMYAASNLNLTNQNNPALVNETITKRDFIRLAVLMYDSCALTIRNLMIARGDTPKEFH